jgi:hypothetical protein
MYAGVYFLGYCFGIISSVMSVSCAKTFQLNNNMPAISSANNFFFFIFFPTLLV